MMPGRAGGETRGVIRSWGLEVRIMVTAFLAMIGGGYLFAVLNIYHTHQLADGEPGLTLNDLRAVYSGFDKSARNGAVPSRMLQMLEGAMRQYVADTTDFEVLRDWLAAGGAEPGLDERRADRTPRRVIVLNCLRCHAQDSGSEISRRSPFGPDQLTVEYVMLSRVLARPADAAGQTVRVGPQEPAHLILITHAHMLSIPLFTLIVGGLFVLTRIGAGRARLLTPLPMLALVLDFSGWWLARVAGGFVHVIVAAGTVFAIVLAVQLIGVAYELWRPERTDRT